VQRAAALCWGFGGVPRKSFFLSSPPQAASYEWISALALLTLYSLSSYNGENRGDRVIVSEGHVEMNLIIVGYLGFVVAALILMWAAFVLTSRYHRKKISSKNLNTWVKLDATPLDSMEEPLSLSLTADEDGDEDEEETSQQSLRTRAQQNGHYSESKKPH
jgi:hypothetical protein